MQDLGALVRLAENLARDVGIEVALADLVDGNLRRSAGTSRRGTQLHRRFNRLRRPDHLEWFQNHPELTEFIGFVCSKECYP